LFERRNAVYEKLLAALEDDPVMVNLLADYVMEHALVDRLSSDAVDAAKKAYELALQAELTRMEAFPNDDLLERHDAAAQLSKALNDALYLVVR
jgi:hypothetical protein